MAWGVNNTGWWGEGEIKFFLDGDGDFPTICGTGTEDYFCGTYNFEMSGGQYTEFSHAVRGPAPGDSPRRTYQTPAPLRDVPLARHGSGALRRRPESDHAGARLAQRRPLPAASGRHRARSRSGTRASRTPRSPRFRHGTRSRWYSPRVSAIVTGASPPVTLRHGSGGLAGRARTSSPTARSCRTSRQGARPERQFAAVCASRMACGRCAPGGCSVASAKQLLRPRHMHVPFSAHCGRLGAAPLLRNESAFAVGASLATPAVRDIVRSAGMRMPSSPTMPTPST